MLSIVFQDPYLIAINKPHGLLVHRSPMAKDASEFAIQTLRDQIETKVFPTHRLDRKTSGVLLFSFDKGVNSLMQVQFQERRVAKTYLAILRGHTDDSGIIDYPLTNDKGKTQEAVTHYKTLQRSEIPVPFGKHNSSRYSLVEAKPETGRMHQLRKHFDHIFHPIIADRAHGCNKQNRLFKEKWNMTTMMLHASSLAFNHPITGERVEVNANVSEEFERTKNFLDLID